MDQRILVGVDGSAASRAAIRWALSRAALSRGPVTLVHVVDDEWGAMGERDLGELHPSLALVEAELAYALSIGSPVNVETGILTGDPMVELAEASRTAALVVVGTHKTGFIHGRIFGSRSLRLVAMAWCPVAVIPESSFDDRHGVVVGVDDSDAGRAAVVFAAGEAEDGGEDLTLLRATRESSGTLSGERTAQVLDAAVRLARDSGADGAVRTRVIRRTPAESLVDSAASAKLLVIGSSRRRGTELSALGPVCHDVLLNIPGPTVVVHGDMASIAIPEKGRTA